MCVCGAGAPSCDRCALSKLGSRAHAPCSSTHTFTWCLRAAAERARRRRVQQADPKSAQPQAWRRDVCIRHLVSSAGIGAGRGKVHTSLVGWGSSGKGWLQR